MTRYAHFVGSLPAALMTDDQAVLRWFADNSAGHPITALPCDLDPDWIIRYLRERKDQDVFEVAAPGDYADYNDFASYGLRSGCELKPEHVSMGRVERIGEVVAAFDTLRQGRPELATTKVQISQPNPLDLSMFVFAGATVSAGIPVWPALRGSRLVIAALRRLPVFTEAMVAEMTTTIARHGDRVIFQLESPFALLSMVKAQQLRAQWAVAPLIARQLAGTIARMQEIGADVIVHLCYGDYNHKALLTPRDLTPAVKLLNHTARQLNTRGIPLPPVHIPCAYAAEPAPLDEAFYAPLRRLSPDWRVIAGVVSPNSREDSVRALELFEAASNRTAYAVSTACGLGRCGVEDAKRAVAHTVSVAQSDDTRG